MRFRRWIVRSWAAGSAAYCCLILFQHGPLSSGEIAILGGDGIAMALMIFLMTVEGR